MNYVNYDAVIETLISHEFDVSQLEIGSMRRVKRGRKSQKGWYIVHGITLDDGQSALIGSFGYFEGAEKFQEKIAPGKEHKLSKEQLEAIRKQHAEATKKAEAQRKAESERASHEATRAWFKYVPEGESAYFQRKMVRAHGVKFAPSGNGTVAIPMKDTAGKVWGLQIIRGKDRGNKMEKEYWPKGLNKKSHFHTLGSLTPHTKCILIGEGYATCATLFQATEIPTLVAFDAGNLQEVAIATHKAYPRAKILICADDDYLTDGNPGCKKAEAAALAVGGAWIKPEFPASREGKKLTDFNDLANFPNCSESTVRVQILDKLNQLGWGYEAASAPRAAASSQGGGEGIKGTLKSLLQVDEAVERYSLIYGAGGTMYDHQEYALIPKSDVLDICVDHAWREWKLHPMRSVVRLSEVGFDPTGKDKNIICNLWGGWPTKPKSGDCSKLLELLDYLCQGEEEDSSAICEWVIKWLAYPIQHPGAKMKTALIFHGPQGAGKNLFFEAYAQIFGKYSRIVGQAEIDDKFNDWASGKLFMIADEVVARQELFHIKNKLKALITGDTIRINPKNVAAHDEKNHVNLVFLSNEKQPLVIEKDDRRYVVIWTPGKLELDQYKEVAQEIAEGGIEALHDYLLNYPLGDFNEHTKPPATKSKQDLIDINLESSDRFLDLLISNELPYPVCPCVSEDLYKAYSDWAKRNGVLRPRELSQMLGNIAKMPGWQKIRARIKTEDGEKIQRTIIIPPEIHYQEKYKMKLGEVQSDWLSQCCGEFKTIVGGKND